MDTGFVAGASRAVSGFVAEASSIASEARAFAAPYAAVGSAALGTFVFGLGVAGELDRMSELPSAPMAALPPLQQDIRRAVEGWLGESSSPEAQQARITEGLPAANVLHAKKEEGGLFGWLGGGAKERYVPEEAAASDSSPSEGSIPSKIHFEVSGGEKDALKMAREINKGNSKAGATPLDKKDQGEVWVYNTRSSTPVRVDVKTVEAKKVVDKLIANLQEAEAGEKDVEPTEIEVSDDRPKPPWYWPFG